MATYAPGGEQLAVELYIRDLPYSLGFYQKFGFTLVRQEPDFAELRWDDALLMLEVVPSAVQTDWPVGNVRILVPNVDEYWALAQELQVPVVRPIEDRYYGLRDFTIAGPDGLGLRFATRLGNASH